ncbi:hypothetical protein D5085_15475 [Ectothiorhodospiraceae bacterium BW-2]|nr:hypothetical protein D5085_15475 [Ectothiorhodospiraceae bacterium BW-2]
MYSYQLSYRISYWSLTASLLLISALIHANGLGEIWVVVSPQSEVSQLTKSEVINLYMGRQRTLGEGRIALPVELAGNNALKAQFYQQLMEREISEINSYWARLIFSGQNSPPRQLASLAEIRQSVRDNPGAIGYLPAGEELSGLTVVFTLKE